MSRFGASYGLGSAVLSALLVIQQAGKNLAYHCPISQQFLYMLQNVGLSLQN